jgi:large subunit ribosomal protein L4
MATADSFSSRQEKLAAVELDPEIFAVEVREHLLHDAVLMQLANRRRGCASTKSRSDMRGGGLKPWKQKGTGRARVGSRRSPLWRGGSTIFGPKPRSYEYRIPRSARRGALCAALSLRASESKLLVVDGLGAENGKTKALREALERMGVTSALIVFAGDDSTTSRAARNMPAVKALEVGGLNVFDVLDHEHLILTRTALEAIGRRLGAS